MIKGRNTLLKTHRWLTSICTGRGYRPRVSVAIFPIGYGLWAKDVQGRSRPAGETHFGRLYQQRTDIGEDDDT